MGPLVALLALGCTKKKECPLLVGPMTEEQKKTDELWESNKDQTDGTTFSMMSDRHKEAATAIARVQVTHDKLVELRDGYVKANEERAKVLKEIADAAGSGDQAGLEAASNKLTSIERPDIILIRTQGACD